MNRLTGKQIIIGVVILAIVANVPALAQLLTTLFVFAVVALVARALILNR